MGTRILHVIDSLGAGGAERVVATLAREQSRRHPVAVAHLLPEATLAAELRASGVDVFPLGVAGWHQLGLGINRLHRLVARLGVGVLHAHLTMATLAVGLVPATAPRRIVTFHNLGLSGGAQGGVKTRMLRGAMGRLVRWRFGAVTAVSRAAALAYKQELQLAEAPRVIPNPVDVTQLRLVAPASQRDAREMLGLPTDIELVVTVAKLTWEKNQRTLLDALALIPEGERPMLAIIGDGPLAGELRAAAARLRVSDWVRWCGARPSEEIPRWLRAATLFVLPSVSEGQPVSVLEAMSLGLPVVATRVGGLPELLECERGWLVEPRSAPALAAALREALADPHRRAECAERAVRVIDAEFAAPVVALRWEQELGA